MKTIFTRILMCAVIAGAVLCGCNKSSESKGFEASLSIYNEDGVVSTGETLFFQIKTSGETYRLVSLEHDARLAGTFPETGKEYASSTVFFVQVTVSGPHDGKLSVVVEDPVTKTTLPLEAPYSARTIPNASE